MIKEFIRECLMFKTKDIVTILIGITTWALVCFNAMLWMGVIHL